MVGPPVVEVGQQRHHEQIGGIEAAAAHRVHHPTSSAEHPVVHQVVPEVELAGVGLVVVGGLVDTWARLLEDADVRRTVGVLRLAGGSLVEGLQHLHPLIGRHLLDALHLTLRVVDRGRRLRGGIVFATRGDGCRQSEDCDDGHHEVTES